jgi:hypothetical protein
MPEGVTKLCKFAFSDCAVLWSVTIPDSLQIVADNVWDGCAALDELPSCMDEGGQSLRCHHSQRFRNGDQSFRTILRDAGKVWQIRKETHERLQPTLAQPNTTLCCSNHEGHPPMQFGRTSGRKLASKYEWAG